MSQTKEEKRKEILTALIHIGTEEGRLCRRMLEGGKVNETDVLLHLASHASHLRSSRIIDHNKLISELIKNLAMMGCWPQLLQIFKSLPDAVMDAFKWEKDIDKFREPILLYTKQVEQFMHMSEAERARLLEIHDGDKTLNKHEEQK